MTDTEIHLTTTDQLIIEEIEANGRCQIGLLADIIDRHKEHVRERVNRLVEHGVLVRVARGLYDTPDQAAAYLPADEAGDDS